MIDVHNYDTTKLCQHMSLIEMIDFDFWDTTFNICQMNKWTIKYRVTQKKNITHQKSYNSCNVIPFETNL